MRRIGFGLYCLALALVCLFTSVSARAQAPSSIQLYMPNGGGPPNRVLRLTLTRDDGFIDIVFTDSNGKYLIATPPRGQQVFYTVTVETDNQTYGTTVASFRLDPGSPNRTIIFLNPLPASKTRPPDVLDVTNFEGTVPSKARAAYKRATELIRNGDFDSAIGSLREAIDIDPQYVSALNDLGVIFMKLNKLDEAESQFRRASEISKRFFHPRMNLGIVLNKQRKYDEALKVLEPLYNENHGMPEVRLAYARALEGARRLADAEKLYRATLDSKNLAPSWQADIHFYLGVCLNREGKFADSADELRRAIAIEDSPNSHLQLGVALMFTRELDEAESELMRAYELGGRSVGAAQLLLGHIYYEQQKFDQAQTAFEKYLTDVPSAPNTSQIAKLIADLKARSRN